MSGRLTTVWTKDKVQWLKENYATTPIGDMVNHFGKTKDQIYAQAKRLDLHRDKSFVSAHFSSLRKEEVRKARLRLKWGLETKVNVRLTSFTNKENLTRRRLRKHGYVLGDRETQRRIVFYDNNTNRIPRTERTAMQQGFRFEELREEFAK